jgi:hypothetical protein
MAPPPVTSQVITPASPTGSPLGAVSRRIVTRSADTRLPAATALHNALAELDMEEGPHTLDGHEMAVNTLLANLRKAHFNYVENNALKIEDEPHKSYLVPFHTKLERVLGIGSCHSFQFLHSPLHLHQGWIST